jgi:hypothetical protein
MSWWEDNKWFIVLFFAIFAIVTGVMSSSFNPLVSGTKRWATYTGVIMEFDIDCEQCCHAQSGFRINTSSGVKSEGIVDCDEDLENLVHIGRVYTIRIEPFAEPYAITHKFGEPSSYWAVCIDWIKDSNGNVIYGNEWF